jgi:hypothetical protein
MAEEKRLEDVADKVISLEEVLFPKDKTCCPHIALDGAFIIRRNKGCIFKCANCGKYVEIKCRECAIGETIENKTTGETITVLPCAGLDLKKSGEWK